MIEKTGKVLRAAGLALLTTVAAGAALVGHARAESPFHTGVWQVNAASGPFGLVVSDWLMFEDGLPSRWIYTKGGSNDINQFDFTTRAIGMPVMNDVDIRVYRTGDNTMRFTRFVQGRAPEEYTADRLSEPNYANSCLSVENKGDRLFGTWVGTSRSTFKSINLDPGSMTIDGVATAVEIRPVRVGRLGILKDGVPIAFLTDAGGDYAVVQWFNPGVTVAQMEDDRREILDFRAEEVVRDPNSDCDQQIAARLKLLGSK